MLQKYTAAEMLIVAEASDGSAYAPASFTLGARFQLTRLLLEANVAHQEARLAPPTYTLLLFSIDSMHTALTMLPFMNWFR